MSAGLPALVFARPPRADHAKTRLAPELGTSGAASLYGAFLADTVETCRSVAGLEPELWVAGDPWDDALAWLPGDLPRHAQPRDADLGHRMATALRSGLERAGWAIVRGSDVPTLPPSLLEAAYAALGEAEVVLGPAADGGYWLVGARGAVPPVFEGVRWSGVHTLGDTLDRASEHGIAVHLLPPWYDVDTPADLALLRAHLAIAPGSAPRTARSLGL